jgi:hypothetical protein
MIQVFWTSLSVEGKKDIHYALIYKKIVHKSLIFVALHICTMSDPFVKQTSLVAMS